MLILKHYIYVFLFFYWMNYNITVGTNVKLDRDQINEQYKSSKKNKLRILFLQLSIKVLNYLESI